ncbi:conserved Plasmodium protein, unknown function [Plasmodium vivax]|uniref:Uncharacterized protein n=1 Tax=Plasmodium vivax TaxID=5855 RepID=A0A1G4GR26_PLAVI|nr:conserved Plasmodium protein, unknown function [Plasmodium vivax]
MKIIELSSCNVGTINHLPNGRPTREAVKEGRSSDRKGEQHVVNKKSLHVKVSRVHSGGETSPHAAPPERNTHTDGKNGKDKKGPGPPKGEANPSEGSTTPTSTPTMKIGEKPNVGTPPRGRHSNGEHSKWRQKKNGQDAQESANISEEKNKKGKKKKKKNDPPPEGGRRKRLDSVPGDGSNRVHHLKKTYTLIEGGASPQHFGGLTELEEDSFEGALSSENSSAPCDKAEATNCSFGADKMSTQETPPMRELPRGNTTRENPPNPPSGERRVEKTPNCWQSEVYKTVGRSCNGEASRTATNMGDANQGATNEGATNEGATNGVTHGSSPVAEERPPEGQHPKRDTPSDGANNGDGEEGDKRASTPAAAGPPKNEIEELKGEIKKELYNRLSIALDINMSLNENEKYYDLFKKKKKFQKYIMNSCKFVIILGKHLNLSFSTISIALYYLHKYHEKVLKRKKNALPYLVGGACIFLAWKMREDMENLRKSKKLYDIPKMIFKLLNYFDKKKKIKKKMRELQVGMVLSGCAYRRWEDLSDEHTLGSTAGDVRSVRSAKNARNATNAGHTAKGEGASARRRGEEARPPGEASQRGTPPRSGKKKRKLSPRGEAKRSSVEPGQRSSLHRDLAQIKRIINAGYVSDVNNISHASDCFSAYLSECNSGDVSEYEVGGADLRDDPRDERPPDQRDERPPDQRDELPPDQRDELPPDQRDELPPDQLDDPRDERPPDQPDELPPDPRNEQTYLTRFQQLCKREKRRIHISASKWVLNNSGQKLQLMQKVLIYYEGEILKSINYFLKPDRFSFDLLPSFVASFANIMKGYVEQDEVASLQKIASLSVLDFYKTPLCLVFTSKEIMVACILRAYTSLKWICGQLDLRDGSLQDFEKKATLFTQHVSLKNPISITRVKIAMREIRQLGE